MLYYKKGNSTFALKTEPKKFVEEEVEKEVTNPKTNEKKVVKRKIRKAVFDDSYTPITEKEFNDLNEARLHK